MAESPLNSLALESLWILQTHKAIRAMLADHLDAAHYNESRVRCRVPHFAIISSPITGTGRALMTVDRSLVNTLVCLQRACMPLSFSCRKDQFRFRSDNADELFLADFTVAKADHVTSSRRLRAPVNLGQVSIASRCKTADFTGCKRCRFTELLRQR